MTIDLELIRSRNPIEDIVGETFPLKKIGKRFIGVEHDSLVVIPQTGFYFWNSQGQKGDVFDFVARHVLRNQGSDHFLESVRWLAQRANLPFADYSDLCQSPAYAERQLIQRLHEVLFNTPAALRYVTEQRGWQHSTIQAARLGYMPRDKRKLLTGLSLSEKWSMVIQKFPPEMIVYVHLVKGRLMYLSGRSIEGKKHYNPPRELIGDRQPYSNYVVDENTDQVVLVEGQADAISFAEWDIPAIALGGMQLSEALLNRLRDYRRVFIALDNTEDAQDHSRQIAQMLGGKAYLPQFPDGVKDANEWLAHYQVTAEDAQRILNQAPSWLASAVERVSHMEGLAQEDAIRDLFQYAHDLDVLSLARFKATIASLGIQGRAFDKLLKAEQAQHHKNATEEDKSGVFDDNIPVLSPALGFSRDLALVTISLRERTSNNRLNVQPYLVTSTRELVRLKDQQILTIHGQEIALRVVPEGSEFLMRWRHGDIQRFLKGEEVNPGEVFNTIHNLFTIYIDFRSSVESRILTLWTIGTY
ncbi:MAG TPA: toprim domain-containing protein, partial [Aggregatilineaceae bacterium]|nr:toprim domain-containing protein [Aggregatilineaceae bacterium]